MCPSTSFRNPHPTPLFLRSQERHPLPWRASSSTPDVCLWSRPKFPLPALGIQGHKNQWQAVLPGRGFQSLCVGAMGWGLRLYKEILVPLVKLTLAPRVGDSGRAWPTVERREATVPEYLQDAEEPVSFNPFSRSFPASKPHPTAISGAKPRSCDAHF